MAAGQQQQQGETHNVSFRAMVCALLAGMAVTVPLLGMMGFSLLSTLIMLVISSPLLLIFSPLLLSVGLLFAGVLAGFAIAAAMALVGVSTLAWTYSEIRGSLGAEKGFGESGERVKEQGMDRAEYLQQNVLDHISHVTLDAGRG